MTMDYGLTPAEQAAQRATQRADDTRRRRTVRTYPGMTGTDPGDFGGTPNNPSRQIARSPIIPPVRTAPMTGPAPRDWQTGMSGLPAFEPKVPLDLSRAGQKQTLGRSPVPPMQQEINPLQLPFGAVRAQAAPTRPVLPSIYQRIDDVFDAARKGYQFVPPNPNPTTGYPLRGEINPMGSNFMLTDSTMPIPGFQRHYGTEAPWDHTQPYPTPSRIGPAVVPPRGFTGQIERGYRGYPQMQQEINPLRVPPVLGNALQNFQRIFSQLPMAGRESPYYPMSQVVEGF